MTKQDVYNYITDPNEASEILIKEEVISTYGGVYVKNMGGDNLLYIYVDRDDKRICKMVTSQEVFVAGRSI